MAVNKNVLRKMLAKSYKYTDLTIRDVTSVINQYKDLKPVMDMYVFNDGSNRELLSLTGTVPVSIKGTVYNIPICLWLLDTYPYNPPICFVKPTSAMMIKTGKHVDANGKIYLPYLHEWKHPESDLFGLIQVMIVVFGEEPPVFARSTTQTSYPGFQAAGPPNVYIVQNSYDMQVKKTSGLQETEPTFQPKEGHENHEYTVAEIKKLGPGQTVEVVNLKVAHVKPTVSVRGVEMDLCKVYGSDQTGSIKVNLWNDAVLSFKAGCIYRLTNLETRKKDGKVLVTTTKNTVITEITDMGVVHAHYRDEMSDEECSLVTIDTCVTGIKIVQTWMCAMCNKPQATFDRMSTFHRCEHCKMKQKTSAFRCASRGTLCLGDGSKASISNTVLSTYLKRENIMHLSLDAEKIEEHFLVVEQFQITIADQCVVVDLKPLGSPSCSGAGGLHSAEDPVSQSV